MIPATPAALAGIPNGRIPQSLLHYVDFSNDRFLQSAPANRAFTAFVAAAKAAGFTLRSTGGYRSYDQQVSLFVGRYQPVTQPVFNATPSNRRKTWLDATKHGYNSIYWIKRNIGTVSKPVWPADAASPGTSNHGGGYSNDLAEENDGDPAADSLRPVLITWIRANAERYGLVNDNPSENWHWTYVTGDRVPQAVLSYEASLNPAPTGDLVFCVIEVQSDDPFQKAARFGGLGAPSTSGSGLIVIPHCDWLQGGDEARLRPHSKVVQLAVGDLAGIHFDGDALPPGYSKTNFRSAVNVA